MYSLQTEPGPSSRKLHWCIKCHNNKCECEGRQSQSFSCPQTHTQTHTLISGVRRSVDDMSSYIDDIALLLQVRDPSVILHSACLTYEPWRLLNSAVKYLLCWQEADKELKRIEVTPGEPTDDVRVGTYGNTDYIIEILIFTIIHTEYVMECFFFTGQIHQLFVKSHQKTD